MKTLLIFSSDRCGHCTRVLDIVKELDLSHKIIKIEDNLDFWIQTMDTWHVRTVPQIFVMDAFDSGAVGDFHIGGAEDFYPLVDNGDIWKLLEEENG